jgi:hypothetical protein
LTSAIATQGSTQYYLTMRNEDLLSCLEKRDLLNQPAASVDALVEWGDRYLRAGFIHDALGFYEKAGALEALPSLLEIAKSEGDAFLLRRVCAVLGHEPTAEEWLAVAEQAERFGKQRFACKGYEAAGAQDRCEALRSASASSVDP